MASLAEQLAARRPPSLFVIFTPAELGAATDIINRIFQGAPNKREYNKQVKSISSVITQLLAIKGKRLAKGAVLQEIKHSINVETQEVQYTFQFNFDADTVADAFK